MSLFSTRVDSVSNPRKIFLKTKAQYEVASWVSSCDMQFFFDLRSTLVKHILFCHAHSVDRDISAGIATCYGLYVPDTESLWRPVFPHMSRPILGTSQPLDGGYRAFSRGKATEAWR